MTIKILSDTACDLPKEIIEEYGIDILPIVVIKGEDEYLDQVSITPQEVYDGMRNGEIFKTSQIPPHSFQSKFEEYAKTGESVIYISFSSGLSGTYQTSLLVRESIKEQYPELDLEIIDSKAATGGFGLIVLEAARLAKEGHTKDEILNTIKFYIKNLEQIFTVDDMEYLFRGGRISKSTALVGGLLNIKPILEVSEGKLVPLDKVRGKNKVYKRMLDIMRERGENANFSKQTIFITHGDDIDSANKLKGLIEEKYGTKKFIINNIGAAIGAHSGPGTIALFFLKSEM